MPRPKKSEEKIGDRPAVKTCSAKRLSEISGYQQSSIYGLVTQGVLRHEGGEYPEDESIRALFAHLREQTTNVSARTKAHAERTAAAEATSAEVRAAKDLGEACLAKEIEAQWEDVATKVRVIVETFPGLTERQKDGLLEKLAAVKLSEEEKP